MSAKIFAAMVQAQKKFGPALKGKKNPHFGNSYADLAACAEAVTDALNESGIALVQVCHESTDGVIVETKFLHEAGEEWSGGKLFVPATKKDAQGFGSALTYARRYSLMASCGIAPEDDDGNAACATGKPTYQKPAAAPELTAAETKHLAAINAADDAEALRQVGEQIAGDKSLGKSSTDMLRAAYANRDKALAARQV